NATNIATKNFRWTSVLNLTLPKNKLVDFPGLESSPYAYNLIIGQPLGTIRRYHLLDVDPTSGLYRFGNNKDNAVSTPSYPDDYTVLISTQPKFYGGFQNNIRYKNFELDFLFQFVKQIGIPIRISNGSFIAPGAFYNGASNQPTTILNHWQKPGDITSIQKYSADPFADVSNQLSYASS